MARLAKARGISFVWFTVTIVTTTTVLLILPVLIRLPDLVVIDEHRALWRENGTPNYQITVVTGALPVPEVGLELTILNGQITKSSILACDAPSEEFPADSCDTIRTYYSSMGHYTIEQLLDIAADGTRQTQRVLTFCPAISIWDFHGFSNPDDLWKAAQACDYLLNSSVMLTSAEYDPNYGYPKYIVMYTPHVFDGTSSIEIRDFHPLSAS